MSLLVAGARGCEGIHEVMSPPSVTTDAYICTGSRHSHAGGDDSVIERHTHTHTPAALPTTPASQREREREKDGVSPATGHVRTLSHFHSLLSSTNLSLVQCIFYTSNHQFKFDHITNINQYVGLHLPQVFRWCGVLQRWGLGCVLQFFRTYISTNFLYDSEHSYTDQPRQTPP